jgi:hypothetical protein
MDSLSSRKGLDLYVAAMGRSGSTVLCDLYSRYPTHWLMNEPWIVRGNYGPGQLEKVRRFGFEVADDDWFRKREGESVVDRFYRVYASILKQLEFLGAKEVRSEFHGEYYRLMRPEKVVVLVRDIRDVIISLVEKTEIEKRDGYDTDFVRRYLRDNCLGLVQFYQSVQQTDTQVRVLRYEELTQSEACQKELDQFVGHGRIERIPEDGGVSTRPWEIERHGLTISAKTVGRFRSEQKIGWAELYHGIAECAQYNEFFGYV